MKSTIRGPTGLRYNRLTLLANLVGADHRKQSQLRELDMTIEQAYGTLGLDASSTTPDQARSRFRHLIRLNHPDGQPSVDQARANESTRIIVEACALLRKTGFPRRAAVNEACQSEQVNASGWIDDYWRACAGGNVNDIFSPMFAVRFAFSTWMLGWQCVWGSGQEKLR